MTQYELFVRSGCPYCRKVQDYMKKENIELPIRDISIDAAVREKLIQEGGKQQVPCLFIDGKALYESDDIIAYFASSR